MIIIVKYKYRCVNELTVMLSPDRKRIAPAVEGRKEDDVVAAAAAAADRDCKKRNTAWCCFVRSRERGVIMVAALVRKSYS